MYTALHIAEYRTADIQHCDSVQCKSVLYLYLISLKKILANNNNNNIFIPFIQCIHPYVPRQTLSLVDTLLQLLFRFIVNTLYGAYLPRSYVGSDGLLRQHFPQNVCSV